MKITLTREDLNRIAQDKKYMDINIYDFSSALPREVFNASDCVVFIENDGTSKILKERKSGSSELRNKLLSVRRDFVQETINGAKRFANYIQPLYDKFNNGELTVEEFHESYCDRCANLREDLEDESYTPNNGCTYILNDGSEINSK